MKIKNYSLFISITFTVISSFTGTSYASSTEDAYIEDFPVILSASRLEQPELETPGSVTVIDRKLIELSGARSIPELFRYVPGMQLGHATDNIPVVVYHGLGDRYSRRVQVLIDGRSVYTPAFGGVSWENLPLTVDDIERIEVIRGSNSALYGSNSFSAVISITTRFAAGTVKSGITSIIEDSQNNSVKANWNNSHEDFEYSISGFYFTDNGKIDETNTSQSTQNVADNDRRKALNIALNYQLTGLDNIHLDAGILEGSNKSGNPANTLTDVLRDTDRDYNYIRLKHDHQFENGNNFNWQYFRTNERHKEDDFTSQLPSIASLFTSTEYESTREELELVFTSEITDSFRYVVGGSIRQDHVVSASILQSTQNIDVSRGFINTETRITDSTLLGLGAMYEDHEYSGHSISPKASIIQKLGSNSSVRVIGSKSTRSPVALEEAGRIDNTTITLSQQVSTAAGSATPLEIVPLDTLSTGNLENEEQTSYELGLKTLYGANNQSSFDIRLFYDEIENLIHDYKRTNSLNLYPQATRDALNNLNTLASQINSPIPQLAAAAAIAAQVEQTLLGVLNGTENFSNFVDMTVKGVEIELLHQLSESVHLLGGAAYINMDNNNTQEEIQQFINSGISSDEVNNRTTQTARSAPKESAYAGFIYTPDETLGVNISYHYVGNSDWLGQGEPNLGTQQIINFYAQTKHPVSRNKNLTIGIGIRNLTNDNYTDFNPRNPSEVTSYFKIGLDI